MDRVTLSNVYWKEHINRTAFLYNDAKRRRYCARGYCVSHTGCCVIFTLQNWPKDFITRT